MPDSERGEVYTDKWREVSFKFLEDASKGSTRPRSEDDEVASFGEWEWSGRLSEVSKVRATVNHICNPDMTVALIEGKPSSLVTGKMRTTMIGAFPVDRSTP